MIQLPHIPDHDARTRYVTAAGLFLFALSIVNSAWVCDDAYITFRSIDNCVNGYGLRWNIAERVQTFTHPLWLFLLTPVYLLSGNIYYSSVFLNVVLSVSAAWLVVRFFASNAVGVVWICLILGLSKAFVDFSTSGLENSLHHFLLAVYLVVWFKCHEGQSRQLLLFFVCSLVLLTRLDGLLLIAPTLLSDIRRNPSGMLHRILIGFSPLLIWSIIATLYYGSPLPNTAYAKLGTGAERSLLVGLGSTSSTR